MFYFPSRQDQLRFELLCLPLSQKFINFLVGKGLNVLVLPEDASAERLCYELLRFKREPLSLVDRLPHEHPHFQVQSSTIVFPRKSLEESEHNVVLHEIGHALDFLYWGNGRLVSDQPQVAEALRKVPPLDFHCHEQDEKNQRNTEQFATSFEAFFHEPFADNGKQSFHSIIEIDESWISLMKRYFVEPFRD